MKKLVAMLLLAGMTCEEGTLALVGKKKEVAP